MSFAPFEVRGEATRIKRIDLCLTGFSPPFIQGREVRLRDYAILRRMHNLFGEAFGSFHGTYSQIGPFLCEDASEELHHQDYDSHHTINSFLFRL